MQRAFCLALTALCLALDCGKRNAECGLGTPTNPQIRRPATHFVGTRGYHREPQSKEPPALDAAGLVARYRALPACRMRITSEATVRGRAEQASATLLFR